MTTEGVRRGASAPPRFTDNYAVAAPAEDVAFSPPPGAAGSRPDSASRPGAEVGRHRPGAVARGLCRTMRPRQWLKNALVAAAPLAAGSIAQPPVLAATLVAFALFCAAASGVYLINDVRDAAEDRRHPRKRFRPVAAGIVPAPLAVVTGVFLLAAALTGGALLARPQLAGVLGAYVAISLAYSFFLKDQPVLDLAVVASGFLLRGIAGGAASGIPLSQWFLLVAAFGALFMVAGKRYAELLAVGGEAGTRRSLRQYSASYLRFVWGLSAGVACTTYSLWAFELGRTHGGFPWETASIAPFVLGILRYAVDVDSGNAGAPEDVVLGDRVLLGLGAIWVVVVGVGALTR